MGVGEHLRVLDADGGERVDREEAPVVEVVVGLAPVDEAVVLLVVRARAGCEREPVLAVVEVPLAHLDRRLVAVADDRDQDLAVTRRPVDVERDRVLRLPAEPQHVPPPRVLGRRRDTDVVGHDVDEHAHAQPACLGRQRGEALGPAALRVDVVERDDVVPVLAAGLGGQQRREVDPVDTEVVQVRQPACGLEEVEVGRDLQAVRRDRHPHGLTPSAPGRPTRPPTGRARPRAPGARGARPCCGAGS